MYGGDLPSSQSTSTSRPGEDQSRFSSGSPDSSKPSSQSDDDPARAVENQHLSVNDSHSSHGASRSSSGTHQQRSLPSSRLEVQLPYMSRKRRAEYRRIEDPESPLQSERSSPASSPVPPPSEPRTPPPRPRPDLTRFVYGGGVVTPVKRPANDKRPKPKGPTRAEKVRKRSTFLKAAIRANEQRAEAREELGARAQPSVPVAGTGGGADDDHDEDVSMVPIHPSFLAEYGVDVVMG